MDKKYIKEAAREHVVSALGKEQTVKNKEAAKAIETDFIAGAKRMESKLKEIETSKNR